jgi:hypothetical protein
VLWPRTRSLLGFDGAMRSIRGATVIPTAGSRSGDTARGGVVVEDYADTVIDNSKLGRRCCDGRSPSTTAVSYSPPSAILGSPKPFRLTEENHGMVVRYALGVRKKMLFTCLNVRRRKHR